MRVRVRFLFFSFLFFSILSVHCDNYYGPNMHCVAFVRIADRWYLFDDKKVDAFISNACPNVCACAFFSSNLCAHVDIYFFLLS